MATTSLPTAAALPDARIAVIDGQQHIADVMVPETFAAHLADFLWLRER